MCQSLDILLPLCPAFDTYSHVAALTVFPAAFIPSSPKGPPHGPGHSADSQWSLPSWGPHLFPSKISYWWSCPKHATVQYHQALLLTSLLLDKYKNNNKAFLIILTQFSKKSRVAKKKSTYSLKGVLNSTVSKQGPMKDRT